VKWKPRGRRGLTWRQIVFVDQVLVDEGHQRRKVVRCQRQRGRNRERLPVNAGIRGSFIYNYNDQKVIQQPLFSHCPVQ